jgi:hypothetical protein
MIDEFSLRDSDNLKTKIKKLVSFEDEKALPKTSRRKTVQNPGSSPIPAKYAKVLSCSFIVSSGGVASSVRKKPKIVYFPELTT